MALFRPWVVLDAMEVFVFILEMDFYIEDKISE